jgi:hypothetical protein
MNDQEDRIKQREALENAYDNFVEPYVNQFIIEVNAQPSPSIDVTLPGFCCVSGWLVLTLLYCFWMRYRSPIKTF